MTNSLVVDDALRRYLGIVEKSGLLDGNKNSPAFQQHMEILRAVLILTEEALVSEGLPAGARERVVHTVIWGTPDVEAGVRRIEAHVRLMRTAETWLGRAFLDGVKEAMASNPEPVISPCWCGTSGCPGGA